VLVGSNVGQLFHLDSRKDCQIIKKYNQAQGALTDLSWSEDQSHICTVSLDRHLRVYNLAQSEMVVEQFMYQKLESCSFCPGDFDLEQAEIDGEEEQEPEVVEEEDAPKKKPMSNAELFRDKLQKSGGKLNHNFIKLKYEKRITVPARSSS
jgi:WD40 repeat protein